MNFKKYLQRNWQIIFLVLFMLIAFVLRFKGIAQLQYFTFDQSRDALYVKRMIVDGQLRLLGTQTSLPGMYLPPFYYYTVTPILWLFRFNPIAIDIYSASVGVLSIPLVFFIANKIFGRPSGIFSAGLWAVSPLIVELTRRAWNPNTLPFFILISFYFLYRYYKERKLRDFLLSFGFYGYCLNLHFGAWTLMPLFIFSWFYHFFKSREKQKLLGLLGSLGLIIFFIGPLLLFELRHNFFLFTQAKDFFIGGQKISFNLLKIVENSLSSLVALFAVLISGKIYVGYGAPLGFSGNLKELFSLKLPISVIAQKPFSISFSCRGLLILGLIIVLSFWERKKLSLKMIWVWLFWGIVVSWFYRGGLQFFYYLFLFPIPFLLFGYLFSLIYKKSKAFALIPFFFILLVHLKNTTVLAPTWRDFGDLKKVAQIISSNVPQGQSFNIATIQKDLDRWDRAAVDYRYFTETFYQKRALDWFPEDYGKAQFLFVVDETGKSEVMDSPIMEIKTFNPKRIISSWETDKGIVVYLLEKKDER